MSSKLGFIFAKRKALLFLWLVIMYLGINAYVNIPREEYPEVRIPIIYVSVSYEGISPEDGEKILLKPLEKELRNIQGIKKFESFASSGHASVVLEFEAGFDNEKALLDVREQVKRAKGELPTDVDEPIIREIILSEFPVINVILTGDVPERTMVQLARNLKDEIEELANILSVDIAGDIENTVDIIIDPLKLESYGLSFSLLSNIVNNNKLITAGEVTTEKTRYAIKIPGLLENISEIMNLPLKTKDTKIIRVQDVADVISGYKPRTSLAKVNGNKAVTLAISKRLGTNVIETVDQVKDVVIRETKNLPDNLKIIYSGDSSKRIMETNNDLQNNIIFAVILVMSIILLFVGLVPSLLVAASIPGAFLMAILVLNYWGVTLNVVVLFALILSVGLLVDSAIVVTEYAERKLKTGLDGSNAFAQAVRRMSWPIIASTVTTLVVFMPLVAWPGVVGQFMKYIPITLIATLTASLLMALVFVPVLGSWLKSSEVKREEDEKVSRFTMKYISLLGKVIKYPVVFVLVIVLILVLSTVSFSKFGKGVQFFPDIEPDNAVVIVRARGNSSIYEKEKYLDQIYQKITKFSDVVEVFYGRAGASDSNSEGQAQPEDTIGTFSLEFKDWRLRSNADHILWQIKRELSDIEGVIIETGKEEKGPASGKDIQIEISSNKVAILESEAEKLFDFMRYNDAFQDVEDSRPVPAIEWKLNIDRGLAAQLGVDVVELGQYIKLVTNGVIASNYRPDDSDDEVDFVIKFPEKYRNITQIDDLRIITDEGKSIPISTFITREAQQEIKKISRRDGDRIVSIRANMREGYLASEGVKIISEWLASDNLDQNIRVAFRGEDEDSKETSEFLSKSFSLALVGMALILVLQFNSVWHSIIILSAIFLSTVGVLIGLMVTATPFGIVMCGVGIISLAGIVVNNNIIFIDTFKYYVEKGYDVEKAVMTTATLRLRPILLTSVTTVLGLLPMVLGMNINFFTREITFGAPSSQWWNQLSTTIAGGLCFATILTLFLTPALLVIGERFRPYSFVRQLLKRYFLR